MRILLTGVTGFIGSHVARELLRGGHEVHAAVREGADLRRVADLPALRIHRGGLDHVPVRPELLISLAWIATPGKYLEGPENLDCLRDTRSLLAKVDCRAVVAGTCFEFDTSLGMLREDSPVKPTTLYARCKDELRREVEKRRDSAWVRFFYQYGPGRTSGGSCRASSSICSRAGRPRFRRAGRSATSSTWRTSPRPSAPSRKAG
jgi:nucleoside-diphosphate-sugar epimerase